MSLTPDCARTEQHMGEWLDAEPSAQTHHTKSCETCKDRIQRWQLLSATLATQSRTPLPQPLRKAPFSSILTRADFRKAAPAQNRWERIPWYLRATLEGTGVVAVILIAISAGPRLRSLYERGIERSLQDYGELLVGDERATGDSLPQASTALDKLNSGGPTASDNRDEFAGEEDAEADSEDNDLDANSNAIEMTYVTGDTGQKIRVGKSEIWRFMIKTDSPADLRKRVVSALAELGLAASTPGLGGTLAPGGIQFDLFLSPSFVPRIKASLQKLATPRNPEIPISETFTWYKSRSRRKIPDNKVRIVIWLSQV